MGFVQYECVKSELKDEYNKKLRQLNKRWLASCKVDPSLNLLSKFPADDSLMERQPRSTTYKPGDRLEKSTSVKSQEKTY